MKLTVLTDNTILQSKNFLGEHGLSFYIEANEKKILFDTGYSDVFIKNAQKMGINLLNLNYIVFSHGHYDHTWGLSHYLSMHTSAVKQKHNYKKPVILSHPDTFSEKSEDKLGEIGSLLPAGKLYKNFDLNLTKQPFWITDNLVFLGEIPRNNDFEGKESIGAVFQDNKYVPDYIIDDSALVYKSDKGLVIITGCSHSGICNICSYAKEICQENNVIDIIGGFHLINPPPVRLSKTGEFLKKLNVDKIHPCHCTDLASKLVLSKTLNIEEIGVGSILGY